MNRFYCTIYEINQQWNTKISTSYFEFLLFLDILLIQAFLQWVFLLLFLPCSLFNWWIFKDLFVLYFPMKVMLI